MTEARSASSSKLTQQRRHVGDELAPEQIPNRLKIDTVGEHECGAASGYELPCPSRLRSAAHGAQQALRSLLDLCRLRRGHSAILWGSCSASEASTNRKNSSKLAGEMISRTRVGTSPGFQNVCHWPRGLKTRSGGAGFDLMTPVPLRTCP